VSMIDGMSIDYFLLQASSYAGDIDFLIWFVGACVLVPFLVAEVLLVGFAIKYRKKDGQKALYITGEEKSQMKWISYPHYLIVILDAAIIYFAVQVWTDVKIDLPENPDATIRVVGQQWAWSFDHPGPDGELDTEDDIRTVNELHVEVGKTYVFKLESRDVLHSFSVPVFRLKQDSIPGRVITGWFKPEIAGTYDIQCAEMCGIGHGIMGARIFIEEPEKHAAWITENSESQQVAMATSTP
jgi:cytochrome c oxidase subunit II